jgi:hypothetical protein
MSEAAEPTVPEAEPSLSDLMGADPLGLTKEDRKPIIEYYRSRRGIFLTGGKAPKEPKAAKAPKGGPLPDINLDLGDLDL